MRKLIAGLGVAGLMFAGVGPAVAGHQGGGSGHGGPPGHVLNRQAERQCERNNGTFIDLGGLAYVCLLPTAANEREIRQAERICERQGGALFVAVGNVAYACVLPGFEGPVTVPGSGGNPGFVLDAVEGLRLLPIIVS